LNSKLPDLFTDLLKKSKPSRIVVVASSLYVLKHLGIDEVNLIDGLPALMYYRSKFANISFTLELAKKLEGSGKKLHLGLIRPFNYSCPTIRRDS